MGKLSDEIESLESEVERLRNERIMISAELKRLNSLVEDYKKLCMSVIPNKIYTHKSRGNTTIKFLDGSQQTVKRRKGEKDCIETAIAYCILKQLMSAEDLKKLIKEREEH